LPSELIEFNFQFAVYLMMSLALFAIFTPISLQLESSSTLLMVKSTCDKIAVVVDLLCDGMSIRVGVPRNLVVVLENSTVRVSDGRHSYARAVAAQFHSKYSVVNAHEIVLSRVDGKVMVSVNE